jgi:hypothetical protein
MDIEGNLRNLEERIAMACHRVGRSPQEVTVVAVAKRIPAERVREAFQAGIRHFGENRVQEAKDKLAQLTDVASQATWHMVGHLQSNKAKAALGLFHIVDSVDSLRLAMLINRYASRKVPVLLQVNMAGETVKSGLVHERVVETLERIARLPNLEVRGLMGIAPLVKDAEVVRLVFRRLRQLWEPLRLEELSMGMTDDFEVAIEEGSTMVRIGRAIFGERIVA